MKDDAYVLSSSPGDRTGAKFAVSDCILFAKSIPNFRVICLPQVMLKNCHYNGCTACVLAFLRVRYEQLVSYHVPLAVIAA